MIAALAELYDVSRDKDVLAQAERAADWVVAHRGLPGGGFRHDERDAAGPYLGDTLAMGQGFLALYRVTSDKKWLERAEATVPFLSANFPAGNGAGFVTSKVPTDKYSAGVVERDENIALARFAAELSRISGDAPTRKITDQVVKQAMRYVVTPAIAVRPLSAGTLLAIGETSASTGKMLARK